MAFPTTTACAPKYKLFIASSGVQILEAIKNKELSTAISINRMHLEKSMNFILSKLSA